MPNFKKQTENYAFWIALFKALTENKNTITEQQSERLAEPLDVDASVSETASVSKRVDNLIKECLKAAASQWNAGVALTTYPYHSLYRQPTVPSPSTVDRIVEIVEHAIARSDSDICRLLFVEIIKSPGANTSTSKKFQELYEPLIPCLRAVLSRKSQDICQPPFLDFMQIIIGLYLCDVLGRRDQISNADLRKIGCGSPDCAPLDRFILDPTTTSTVFRLVQHRRTHLECQLARAHDLCIHTTIRSGSPHGLQVTKLPVVIAASTWANRQKAARAFLSLIGPDNVLSSIMGTRYSDVENALNGVRHFGAISTSSNISSAPTSGIAVTTSSVAGIASSRPTAPAVNLNQPASSSTTRLGNVSTGAAPPAKVAGKKRKSIPNKPLIQLGPVMDLTGEDSSRFNLS